MPGHIFIHGEKFSNTQNIVQWIAARTGWPVVTDRDLIRQAGVASGMRVEQIEHAFSRPNSILYRAAHHRKRARAYLKKTLAETLRSEAAILCGVIGHLIPREMPQVLRVLVTAETRDRIHRAHSDRHIPDKKARRQIMQTDHLSFQWYRYLSGNDTRGPSSYDVVVPSDVLDTEAAAHNILEHLAEKANAAPADIRKALDDFTLATEIQIQLAEKGYDVTASSDNGHVLLTIDRNVFRLHKMTEKLRQLAVGMPGVSEVRITIGQHFYQTDIYRRYRFEMSPGEQLRNYADYNGRLRQSAISSLPADIRNRDNSKQIGLDRSLNLQ